MPNNDYLDELAGRLRAIDASSPAVSLADMLAERLLMSGLNHESTRAIGDDTAVEIEVTSNRPDCLGHIGVAREAAVLFRGRCTFPTHARWKRAVLRQRALLLRSVRPSAAHSIWPE